MSEKGFAKVKPLPDWIFIKRAESSYDDAYYRFRARIGAHIGVGPYEPISEAQMEQWVDEFKAEIDAWHEDWKQIKREVKG